MRKFVTFCVLCLCSLSPKSAQCQNVPWVYTDVSRDFVQQLIAGHDGTSYMNIFRDCDLQKLSTQLSDDNAKKTFWINIYNGYIMNLLKTNPSLYDDRSSFFKKKQISIGGQMFSFEDIEHGILRRSQNPYGLGYIRRWFVSDTEKMLRVSKRDHRVHFALNCGAKSCPPVRAYDVTKFEDQITKNTTTFLSKTTTCEKMECAVTPIFNWFRGDFGGKKGIKKILVANGFGKVKDLKFQGYDWTIDLTNYVVE